MPPKRGRKKQIDNRAIILETAAFSGTAILAFDESIVIEISSSITAALTIVSPIKKRAPAIIWSYEINKALLLNFRRYLEKGLQADSGWKLSV